MGTFEKPLLRPTDRLVSSSISFRTSLKLKNFLPLQWRNSTQLSELLKISSIIRGRRVIIPVPRGKKSLFIIIFIIIIIISYVFRAHKKIVRSLSDQVLENTRFAVAHTSDDNDLWKTDLNTRVNLRKGFLQRVHPRYQSFHVHISHRHFCFL